jgi:hypothetical protein
VAEGWVQALQSVARAFVNVSRQITGAGGPGDLECGQFLRYCAVEFLGREIRSSAAHAAK